MSWLSVGECKQHLGKSAAVYADDEELYGFVEAAESMVDALIGVVRPSGTPRVESHPGGRDTLVLRKCPVAAIVSVEQSGSAVPMADMDDDRPSGWYADDVDMGGGIVRHTSWFSFGAPVKVTYHEGRLLIPGNVRLAGLELVAHLWQSSQNGMAASGNPLGGRLSEEPIVFRGYALPNRVRELLGLGGRATDEQLVG